MNGSHDGAFCDASRGQERPPFLLPICRWVNSVLLSACAHSAIGNTVSKSKTLTDSTSDGAHSDADPGKQQSDTPKTGKKRGRPAGSRNRNLECGKSQKLPESFTERSQLEDAAQNVTDQLASDNNLKAVRKRRRKKRSSDLSSGEAEEARSVQAVGTPDWHHQLQTEAAREDLQDSPAFAVAPKMPVTTADMPLFGMIPESSKRPSTPPNAPSGELISSTVTEVTSTTPEAAGMASKTTPIKLLKVNKNGKLISPGTTKFEPKQEILPNPLKRRRGRRHAEPKAPLTVTIIKYGSDVSSREILGKKIDAILSSKNTTRLNVSKEPSSKPAGPPKATHPFFLGKPSTIQNDIKGVGPAAAIRLPSPQAQKRSAVTPGKLRVESRNYQSVDALVAFAPAIGNKRTSKNTGLDLPPWPSKETAHVRNLDEDMSQGKFDLTRFSRFQSRKMKDIVHPISKSEDVVSLVARQLASDIHCKNETSASDFEPPKDVRLPTRLLTTGKKIQKKVRNRVRAKLPVTRSERSTAHPAIETLFFDIERCMTPFDQGRCENQMWDQKYAPRHASHVLQAGKEALVLYEWLANRTVTCVEGKHNDSKSLNEIKKPLKKRRKRADDNFIAASDEEEDEEMVDLSSEHDRVLPTGSASLRRPRWRKKHNVVLISGPHGCGKSALVYAVAKDLDFEVFEINAGSRRSGRNIQDKVGDMSENHLVNHQHISSHDALQSEDTDGERNNSALQRDLDSGRQGTMTSFFKKRLSGTSKPEKIKGARKAGSMSTQPAFSTAQTRPKSQKQSLILFEEADILFEADQQFWMQVTKLAAQSKRPIVITCNDEALIPQYDLPLAAILRVRPPPTELATDYMLVMAGREGHILERDAVSTLYEMKDLDLRASIIELNMWCQMSVGDRKGGLEWMYQRWPPGQDVDEYGQLLRVASKGTLRPGMGCLSHNVFVSAGTAAFDRQHELLKETWTDWGIHPSDWHNSYNAAGLDQTGSMLAALEHLDGLSDAASAMDVYCSIDLPSYVGSYDQPMDPSLPTMLEEERLDYTVSAPVIQADHRTDFSQLHTDMYVQSILGIRRACSSHLAGTTERRPMPTTEKGFTQAILGHKRDERERRALSRPDFSEAFDLLAYSPDTTMAMNSSYNLTATSFDRTFRIVVEDMGPYIRSIVSHELVLEDQRLRLSGLLSEGGGGKRQRTTRAARVALEGGNRETKRRERWFDKDLNRILVMRTAGKSWAGMGSGAEENVSERTEESLPGAHGG